MTIQELGRPDRPGMSRSCLFFDNGMYGTIRAHQERHYPGRVSGTPIENPDFVTIAQAYGFHAESVHRTDQFGPAFERAMASPTGALLHLHMPAEMLTPWESIDQARSRS